LNTIFKATLMSYCRHKIYS